MSAFRGTYSDLRFVKGRKVAQFVIEVPLEEGSRIVEAFGTPNPAAEVWVGFARLEEPAAEPHRREPQAHAVRDAGIVCKEPEFWAFILDRGDWGAVDNENGAAQFVRWFCNVDSRREITPGSDAQKRWNKLMLDYGRWRNRQKRDAS